MKGDRGSVGEGKVREERRGRGERGEERDWEGEGEVRNGEGEGVTEGDRSMHRERGNQKGEERRGA